MELVKHNNHVLKNFQLFIWLRDSHADKVEQYRDCLRTAQVLVVEEVYRQREYAPSWLVCYKDNSIKSYVTAKQRITTESTKLLQILFGKLYYEEEETKRFIAFCAEHGVVREYDKPLKFIFMRFKPSPSAIPVSNNPIYH